MQKGKNNMNERSSIGELKGIGAKTEELFRRLDVRTVGDLIRYYPRTYEIFEDPISIGEAEEGKINTIAGSVFGRIQVSANRKLQITTLYLKDLTGTIKVIWFRMPFLRNTLSGGGILILRGRVVRGKDGLVMEHPEIYYPASKYEEKRNSMQPVYTLTAGLTNNAVIKAVRQALPAADPDGSVLPARYDRKYGFVHYGQALKEIHFPESKESFAAARRRFKSEAKRS